MPDFGFCPNATSGGGLTQIQVFIKIFKKIALELSINVINHIIRKWGAISHNFMRLLGPYIPQSQKSFGTRYGTLGGPRGDTRSGTWGQGWTGQGFFLRGGARVKISGAGQNVRISADSDHLLKEGKTLFEYNSII